MAKRKSHTTVSKGPVRPEFAPLNSYWFISSILGILISVIYVSQYSLPWATAFTVVFGTMFFAGMLSMRRSMPDDQLMPRPKRVR